MERKFRSRLLRLFRWHERMAAIKAERLLAALLRIGWDNHTFAFHEGDEIGPGLLAQIAKKTGLRPEDLSGCRFGACRRGENG